MATTVIKADGVEEPFQSEKLDQSLRRAGASSDVRGKIVAQIEGELKGVQGATTADIYRRAFDLLKKKEKRPVAARYSIKRAIFDLGPSGYPFEQFVAEILKGHGWRTQTQLLMQGKCVLHEVDVMGERKGKRIGVEVKFHNTAGTKTDVKDALYVYARFEDIKQAAKQNDRVDEGWLVTNTRFTKRAVTYGRCAGFTLIGWEYPRGNGLLQMIEQAGVHPLTCLTTLTDSEKKNLLDNNIVLCRSLQAGGHLLSDYGVRPSRIEEVLEEAAELCRS